MNLGHIFSKCRLAAGTLVFAVSLLGGPLQAETLDQLVAEALKNNPDLAAAKAQWEQFSYKTPQAGSLAGPGTLVCILKLSS